MTVPKKLRATSDGSCSTHQQPSSNRSLRRHPVVGRIAFADPLPYSSSTIVGEAARLSVVDQTIEYGRDGSHRILVTHQDISRAPLQFLTDLTGAQRQAGFHKDNPAGFGEAGLPAIGFAID